MSRRKYYWKVLYKSDSGRLYSAFTGTSLYDIRTCRKTSHTLRLKEQRFLEQLYEAAAKKGLVLRYTKSKPVLPKFGKIYVFGKLREAKEFRDTICGSSGVIWKVECKGVEKDSLIFHSGMSTMVRDMEGLLKWWADKRYIPTTYINKDGRKVIQRNHPYLSTAVCSELKLIEEVKSVR